MPLKRLVAHPEREPGVGYKRRDGLDAYEPRYVQVDHDKREGFSGLLDVVHLQVFCRADEPAERQFVLGDREAQAFAVRGPRES